MTKAIRLEGDLSAVDWPRLKAALIADRFDNRRTPEQLRRSFENSFAAVLAYTGSPEHIVGTARVLSDGVCNAYIVDVWTHSALRRQGVGRAMLASLEARLAGQHVYLFSDDQVEFYQACGYQEQPVGLSKVVGRWLHPAA